MLDTSYGFNNLLKEVPRLTSRDTNTSLASKKSSSRTSMLAKTSVPKSRGHLDPSVIHHTSPKTSTHLLEPSHSMRGPEASWGSF